MDYYAKKFAFEREFPCLPAVCVFIILFFLPRFNSTHACTVPTCRCCSVRRIFIAVRVHHLLCAATSSSSSKHQLTCTRESFQLSKEDQPLCISYIYNIMIAKQEEEPSLFLRINSVISYDTRIMTILSCRCYSRSSV